METKIRTMWTNESLETSILEIINGSGVMPSNSYLEHIGRCDVASQISRRGGFVFWAKKLGVKRESSDSDFGWAGEESVSKKLDSLGFETLRPNGVKCPYDILVDGIVRVDVKTAAFAAYGPCKGWFYRVGKHAQSDILILHQHDTGVDYVLPWWVCPSSNVTISRGGGKYSQFAERFDILKSTVVAMKSIAGLWPNHHRVGC